MPGIFEQSDGPQQNASELNSEVCVSDESSATADVDNENTVPPAEVNQTDKINKFLLKSFLERMNQEMLGAEDADDATMDGADERDWQWNDRQQMANL